MSSKGDQTKSFDIAGPELAPRLLEKLRVEVPGYRLMEEIGSGGQATVYRASELTSGLTVAIKILHAGPNAQADARERFRREAKALRALNHPNIVCVIESGQTPAGLDFLVMNYVDGKPLDVLWKDRKLAARIAPEPPARLALFKKICQIVQAAHRAGITHRDLSPSNILLDDLGEPHVLDFGLAATAFDAMLSPGGRNVTVTGQFIGKLKYASPEQARGTRDSIDIRTDVYALGVILYQIMTNGAFPYEVVGNIVDVLNNIIHSKPMPPSALLAARNARTILPGESPTVRQGPPLVNETIEAVVLKALEKNPADRYESAGALGEDIERYLLGTPTTAQPRSMRTGSGNTARSYLPPRKILVPSLCVMLVAAVFVIGRSARTWMDRRTQAISAEALATTQPADQNPVQVAPVKQASSSPMIPTTPPPGSAVDLIHGLDLSTDVVGGHWNLEGGKLMCKADATSGLLEWHYRPPAEYTYRIVFRRVAGNDDVTLILPWGGQQFCLTYGGWNNTVVAFGLVNGQPGNANATAAKSGGWLTNARRYVAEAVVTRDSVKAYLDGKLITTCNSGSTVSPYRWGLLRHSDALGLSGFHGEFEFESVEVIAGAINPSQVTASSVQMQNAPSPAASDWAGGEHQIKNSVGMSLVKIEPGTFVMGSPETERGRAKIEVPHQVTLINGFYMGATEVTIAQYVEFENATGNRTPPEREGFANVLDAGTKEWRHVSGLSFTNPGYDHTDDFPVTFVNWSGSRAYCDWLSAKEQRHYRLPTEAEWEYACRAGTTTRFNTGDTDDDLRKAAWQDGKLHPVALKQPNAWGLYDMHGSVLQWCNDWSGEYPSAAVIDPMGPADGKRKISRGGDYQARPNGCRSATRHGADAPSWSDQWIGFRVVLDPSPLDTVARLVDKPADKPVLGADQSTSLASPGVVENQSQAAPRVTPAVGGSTDGSVQALMPVGSKWVPTGIAAGSAASATVVAVDAAKLVIDDESESQAVHRWTFNVGPGGRITQVSDEPIRVPENSPIVSAIHINGQAMNGFFSLTGDRQCGGVVVSMDMTFKRRD